MAHVGRLVDLAANLPQLSSHTGDHDRSRILNLKQTIAGIRADLARGAVPRKTVFSGERASPLGVPLLTEIEKTVSLIPEVFTGTQDISIYGLLPADKSRRFDAPCAGRPVQP